jgi:hypothetical protein
MGYSLMISDNSAAFLTRRELSLLSLIRALFTLGLLGICVSAQVAAARTKAGFGFNIVVSVGFLAASMSATSAA